MISQVSYDIETVDGVVHLTITPVNTPLTGGNYFSTGVYKLSDGVVGMGDITFDEDMTTSVTRKPKKWQSLSKSIKTQLAQIPLYYNR
jgi:hypothetical protein